MIAIDEPDIEAMIQERLTAGHFPSIQAVLRQALKDAPLPVVELPRRVPQTGAELLEALQQSPLRGLDIDFEAHRGPMEIRVFEFG